MAGIELVCQGSARLLLGGVEVEDVLVRGSYAEGGFRPFLSDIDLAILVRRSPDTHPYDACRSLHRRLRMVRLTNPFVRDTWQTIIPEPQWPLLRAFGGLYGAPRWRSLTGRPPLPAGPVEPRIALAAWWNRQHLWTCLAQRQALDGKETVRALPGSLRKARMFARRIAHEVGAARSATDEADPTLADAVDELARLATDEADPTLAGAIDELARSAELVRDALGDGAGHDAAAPGIVVDPTPREAKALDAIERCPWAVQLAGIASTEGYLLLLADGTWTSEQSRNALRDLVQVRRDTGVSVQLHRVAAIAMAPLRPPVRILRNRTTGALVPDSPFLLREQLIYEALYAATNLWAAAARRDPLPAIRAHLRSAAELCLFLLTDEPQRDARPLTDLLAELAMHDDRLGAMSPRIDTASGSNARTTFAVADAITTRIATLLLERASRRARERVS